MWDHETADWEYVRSLMAKVNLAMTMKGNKFMLPTLRFNTLPTLCRVQARRRLINFWHLAFPTCVHVFSGRKNEQKGGTAKI